MPRPARVVALLVVVLLSGGLLSETAAEKKRNKKQKNASEDPYAEYVWPPPPDKPRIKLEAVLSGRADVEAKSGLKRKLLGLSMQGPYDALQKPFAVMFDNEGRILVSDSAASAVFRFDRQGRRLDVLGTTGAIRLGLPLGLDVGTDGTIYVADAGLKKVVAYGSDGKLKAAYGKGDELENPTDAAVSPDGSRLFVVDSKRHAIVVYSIESGEVVSSFGKRGLGEGEFSWPTSAAFCPENNLYVIDQINSRVQVFDGHGEFLDQFGGQGAGFASFTRPKDVAVDEFGLIYVTDNAFNNVQVFDADFSLLTFIGTGGQSPGQFHGASGVAVRGEEMAVVDQLGKRLQVFKFIAPRDM